MDIDLTEDWYGFKLRGRWLIGPDGDRMTPERLRGLLWRDCMELRRAGYASRRKAEADKLAASGKQRVKVVIVELADLRDRYSGQAAS